MLPRTAYVLTPSVDEAKRAKFEQRVGGRLQIYSGSIQGQCHECKEAVWIGPRSQVAVATGGLPTCEACTTALIDAGHAPPVVSLGNPEDHGPRRI